MAMTRKEIEKALEKHHHAGARLWNCCEDGSYVGKRFAYEPYGYTLSKDAAELAAAKYLADDQPKAAEKPIEPAREPETDPAVIVRQLNAIVWSGETDGFSASVVAEAAALIGRLTKPSPETMLVKLADDMLEAARYAVSDPDHVRAKIANFQVRLEGEASEHIEGRRLSDNLYVGSQWLAIQPSIAEGHLKAAAFELKEKAGRLRPRAD